MKLAKTISSTLCAFAVFCTLPLHAQNAASVESWPNKQIRLVVPFPPGGAVDTLARKLSEDLRKRLNTNVIVDNRPGGGTIIGTDIVAKADPDGYTFLINAPGGIVQLPWMQKVPYDPLKELQPINVVADVPVALIVPTALKVNTFAEFAAAAKATPGKFSFASLGNGSTAHIFGEVLSDKLKAQAVHAPYKGDSPAMVDLTAGRVDYMFNNVLSSINFADRGSVKILAVTGTRRIPAIKDAPTLSELGMPEFALVGWFAIFAPARTPRPITDKFHAALKQAYQTKEFKDYLASSGLSTPDVSVDQFTRQIQDEYEKWGRLIKTFNIHN